MKRAKETAFFLTLSLTFVLAVWSSGVCAQEAVAEKALAIQAIKNVVADYCNGFDNKDIDLLMSVWADDANVVWTDVKWDLKGKAEIRKAGRLIFDGRQHPLGVMGYSRSFKGMVSLSELKKHLTVREDRPEALGYHCDYYYKPWTADWGFSVPYSLYAGLKEGEYEINLQTSYKKGTMKVCDHLLPGKSRETIIFNAHNCHAAQANDDIAGLVVGVELMKRLAKKKNRYSYRLIVAPEHIGTVLYLARTPKEIMETFKFGFFLEMLGNNQPLALQETFTGQSLLDRASHHYLKFNFPTNHRL